MTDNSVVRELSKAIKGSYSRSGSKMGLNTFDLGVCMKALPIIWRWPDEFASHVVMIGPFHASIKELMKYSLMPVSPALEHQMVFSLKRTRRLFFTTF